MPKWTRGLRFLILGWLTSEGEEIKKLSNVSINLDPNFKISQAIVISGYPIQGNLIIAKTDPSNKVQLNDAKIEIDESFPKYILQNISKFEDWIIN